MKEKKPAWKLVPESTIIGIELNLRKPVNETKGADEKPQEEIEVCEPQALFEPFDGPIQAKSLYLHSRIGYERMKEFLLGKIFARASPVLEYHELDPTNALTPILPGFNEDNRVIVKCAKSIRYSIDSGYGKMRKGNLLEVYIELERPTKYLLRRDYNFNPDEFRLTPCRIPIVLSGEREGADRYAGLAFEVLCHQLEPVTTRRINQHLRQDYRDLSPQYLENLITICLYEEAVIATGITRYWLYSTAQNNGFNAGDISAFNPFELHSDDSELSFLQVQRAGVEGVLDFYGSRAWDVVDYFNGRF